MKLVISDTPKDLGIKAAERAAKCLNDAINRRGEARLILSTGASQFETIKYLREADVDWRKVEMFHLDEYVGIGQYHPASFVRYLRERFVSGDLTLKEANFFDGLADAEVSIKEMSRRIESKPVDVALIGIGENAHIAFNDPPADFEIKKSFIIVTLDEACKSQQVREKWFDTIEDVPKTAVTMTVYRILQSAVIISAVPHSQKACAVKNALEMEVSNEYPATILKTHPDWSLYTDSESSSLLSPETIKKFS